jgi:hypothetical protein
MQLLLSLSLFNSNLLGTKSRDALLFFFHRINGRDWHQLRFVEELKNDGKEQVMILLFSD